MTAADYRRLGDLIDEREATQDGTQALMFDAPEFWNRHKWEDASRPPIGVGVAADGQVLQVLSIRRMVLFEAAS